MLKNYLLCSLLLPAVFSAPQAPPSIGGAVSKPALLDAKAVKGLDRHKRMVKVANSEGNFLCSLEVSGYALKDVLDRCGVKKEEDGFDRPLDVVVTAKGRNGGRALFSYGEVFLTSDEGPLLADSARMILPTHHGPLNAGKNDPTIVMLDIKKRDAISLESCASCHHAPSLEKLHFPKGWLLVAANDGFPGRYVEDLTEVTVQQSGIKVEAPPRGASKDMLVESPTIIGPDGKSYPLVLEDYQKLPRQSAEDVGVGIGRGYRGVSLWEGAPLKGLLQPLLPSGVDPRSTYVLVTGADGYRASFSGVEVFNNSADKCVLLIDKKNGQVLGKGSGAFTAIQRIDFFVDRNVRMVKEIRLVVEKR